MRFGVMTRVVGIHLFAALIVAQAWAKPFVVPPASEQRIAQFNSNPEAVIGLNADTRRVGATVLELAGTEPTLARDLVRLAKGTTARYQTAIAAGLAQAAMACMNLDQESGLQIQQPVARFEDGQFQASFAAVAGDLSTAATGAAASAASVAVVNPNSSQSTVTNRGAGGAVLPVPPSSPFASINSLTASTASSGTTTAFNPISPTR